MCSKRLLARHFFYACRKLPLRIRQKRQGVFALTSSLSAHACSHFLNRMEAAWSRFGASFHFRTFDVPYPNFLLSDHVSWAIRWNIHFLTDLPDPSSHTGILHPNYLIPTSHSPFENFWSIQKQIPGLPRIPDLLDVRLVNSYKTFRSNSNDETHLHLCVEEDGHGWLPLQV